MPIIDRVYIDKNDVSLYSDLDKDDFFKKLENKEKFLLALSMGFKNKIRRSLDSKEGYALLKYFKTKDVALIQSIALYESNDPEILKDDEQVFKISEEYAHAGIKIIIDKIGSTAFGDFWKNFEKELYEGYLKIENENREVKTSESQMG
jgi:dnd system-associated protein 4